MSAWRLVVRELYERGPLTAAQIMTDAVGGSGLARARQLGLVSQCPGRGGNFPDEPCHLTAEGIAYMEGRMVCITRFVPHPGTKKRGKGSTAVVRPTWLASLPDRTGLMLQSALVASRLSDQSAGCGVGA